MQTEAPATPQEGQVEGQHVEDANDPIGQSAPEGQQSDAEELFSKDEMAKLSPEDRSRVDGMVKKFMQRTSELSQERKQLADLTQAIRDQAQVMKASQQQQVAEEPISKSNQSKLEAFLSNPRLKSEDRAALQALVDGILEQVETRVQPIAKQVTQDAKTTELVSTRSRYKDFDSVVTEGRLADLLVRYPRIDSYDMAYKLIKHDIQEQELTKSKGLLQKLQSEQKSRAETEQPGGPSADELAIEEFESMAPEKRRRLNIYQLAALAEKKIAQKQRR